MKFELLTQIKHSILRGTVILRVNNCRFKRALKNGFEHFRSLVIKMTNKTRCTSDSKLL